MAQAESVSITSRRRFLAGVAIASTVMVTPLAIAVAAPTKADEVNPELERLSRELAIAEAEVNAKADQVHQARSAERAWKTLNPDPAPFDKDGNNVPNFNKLVSKHSQDYQNMLREIKTAAKQKDYNEATLRFAELAEEFAATEAKHMIDLRYKADVAADFDMEVDSITVSVVWDLLSLKAEA